VPAGDHTVLVRLEDTWPRRLGWLVSGLGLAALVLLVSAHARGLLAPRPPAARSTPSEVSTPGELSPWPLLGVAALGLALAIGLNRAGWPYTPAAFDQPAPQRPHLTLWTSNLGLLGYDLARTTARPGEAVDLTLYWTAAGRVTANSRVFVHLMGPDGQLWANSDKFHPGIYEAMPTGRWPVGYSLSDHHTLPLAPDTPPGIYHLRVGLWNGYTGERVPVAGAAGEPTGDAATLPDTLTIE
jgi:hypothetical protein